MFARARYQVAHAIGRAHVTDATPLFAGEALEARHYGLEGVRSAYRRPRHQHHVMPPRVCNYGRRIWREPMD